MLGFDTTQPLCRNGTENPDTSINLPEYIGKRRTLLRI